MKTERWKFKKESKWKLVVKNTVTEMKNALEECPLPLDGAKERISEFEDTTIEAPKTKNQGQKD
jgi:hypothetical protein